MYHYHNGEVKNPGLEMMLVLVRVLIFVFVVIVSGAIGFAAGLPAFVGGTAGALVIFAIFSCRPFMEVMDYTCPGCGNKTRVIKNFGAYKCSNCGHENRI